MCNGVFHPIQPAFVHLRSTYSFDATAMETTFVRMSRQELSEGEVVRGHTYGTYGVTSQRLDNILVLPPDFRPHHLVFCLSAHVTYTCWTERQTDNADRLDTSTERSKGADKRTEKRS